MTTSVRKVGGAVLAAFALLFLLPAPAGAQITSRVDGTVTDDAGVPLEGVEIFLKNAQTNAVMKPAKTKKTGKFLYITEPGDYYVSAIFPGHMVVRMIADLRNQDGVGSPNTNFFDEKQTFDKKLHFYPAGDLNSKSRNRLDFVLVPADRHRATLDKLYAEFRGEKAAASGSGAADAPLQKEADPYETAVTLIEQKDFAGAIPKLKEAIEKDPEDVDRYYQLGRAALEIENYAEAEPALKKAKEIDATKPGVSFYLALLYDKKGRKVQAVQMLEEEKALSPDSEAVLDSLAGLYADTGQQDKAIESYESLIASHPDHIEAYLSLAALYKDAGDQAKEEDVYKRLGDRDPSGDALYNLGNLAFNRSEHDKAGTYYQKVLEKNPNHSKAHLQLGYTMINLGDFKGAIGHMETFLKLSPKDPKAPEAKAMVDELKKISGPAKASGKG